jgi:hypothetical protein
MTHFLLYAALAVAAWAAFIYVHPFGRCPRCHGRRTVMRGTKRKPRPVICPACNGVGRRQLRGSRTVHRLARRVRRELDRQPTQRQNPITRNPITRED